MISVVICSVDKKLAQQVKANIDNTIGVAWQDIIIDNTNPSRGLTEVYNDGVTQAKFPVICFVHEDAGFLTMGWGKLVTAYFNTDPALGMIGVAGAAYKSKTLSGWMVSAAGFDRCNILHLDSNGNNTRLHFDDPPQLALKEVVDLDGVFLCTRKDIMTAIPFDQVMLRGFHLYDLDISFRISRSYKVAVSFEIDIIHYTEGGDFGDKWVDNTLKWHKKYSDQLPVYVGNISKQRQSDTEYRVKLFWLKRLKTEKISLWKKVQWITHADVLRHLTLWPHIFIFFLFRPVRYILGK